MHNEKLGYTELRNEGGRRIGEKVPVPIDGIREDGEVVL